MRTVRKRKRQHSESLSGGKLEKPKQRSVTSPISKKKVRTDRRASQERRRRTPEAFSYPCRLKEFVEIADFVEEKLVDNIGGCMYISGMPGTGKTATVLQVIRYLRSKVEEGELTDFSFAEINGMKLPDPKQAYVALVRVRPPYRVVGAAHQTVISKVDLREGFFVMNQVILQEVLKHKKVIAPAKALRLLDTHYRSKDEKRATVILVDEMDLLYAKRQKVLYNLFEWPQLPGSNLIILSIANTMDLPERMLNARVESRLGHDRLAFQAYTSSQLEEVVRFHLKDAALNNEAMMLASKKIAGLSGDARRVLDLTRRAKDIAEARLGKRNARKAIQITLADVVTACEDLMTSPMFTFMKNASEFEKLFLRSIVSEYERTGTEEAVIELVLNEVMEAYLDRVDDCPSVSQLISTANRLSAMDVIRVESKTLSFLNSRIALNCTVDDVKFATK